MFRALIAIAVLTLLNVYVANGVISRWPAASLHWSLSWGLAILFLAVQLAGPFGERLFFRKIKDKTAFGFLVPFLGWASYLSFGLASCLLVYVLAADVFGLLWNYAMAPTDLVAFNGGVLAFLLVFTAVTTIIGIWQAFRGPVVIRVDIPLKNLPQAFDGFTIAQVSDLHIGPTIGRRYAEKVVDAVNALRPDLIALTGDFVDGWVGDLQDDVAPLAKLDAPFGKFYITGNHEYYWNAAEWMAAFRHLGARVLKNDHEIIRKDGAEIVLAGVTDHSTVHMNRPDASDPVKAIIGAPKDRVKILLAHQPVAYRAAAPAGYDLQLSGHTHGGQYFPFNMMIRFFQTYYKGLNRHENMWVYVNRGTGYWGPPLRTFVGSEITLITLRQETLRD